MKDRVNKKRLEKFTTTSNKILQDSRLSYDAIGVFMYLWSMPDDWQVMVKQVMKHNNSTEYSVRKALRELRDCGYMKWKRTQGYFEYDICEDGTFHCGDIQYNEGHYSDSQHNDIYIQNNNINKTITETNTASGFSSSQSSYSEMPNNSTFKENLNVQQDYILNTSKKKMAEKNTDFEEFWKEFCNICKAKGSTAGEKKPAEIEYQKAVKIAGHQGIMRTLEVFKAYILLAFENNKHACRWLKNIHWPDFEEAINNYKQQAEVLKAEAKKQGKPLLVAQKTPEKQQGEVKMKEDAQKKREGVIRHLNGEEMQFMKHTKEVLKTYFDVRYHGNWIDDFVFSCRNKIAYFGFTEQKYIETLSDVQRWQGFTRCVMREVATFEGLNAKRIELKLID